MEIHSSKKFFCCYDCFNKLTKNPKYEVEKLQNNSSCDCSEIEHELCEPTPCYVCNDNSKSGCPMHLYYVKVTIDVSCAIVSQAQIDIVSEFIKRIPPE